MLKKSGSNGGFFKINNDLFDKILSTSLNKLELLTLLCVIRFTLGYNRTQHELSLRYISKNTGIAFQHISKAIKVLNAMNIISVQGSESNSQGRVIILNTEVHKWGLKSNQIGYSNQNGDCRVTNLVTDSVTKSVIIKIHNKDKFKIQASLEALKNEFDRFWGLYGKSIGRAKCFKMWQKLTEGEKAQIFITLPNYLEHTPDIKYRKYPERYLKDRVWEDDYRPIQTPGPSINDEFNFIN